MSEKSESGVSTEQTPVTEPSGQRETEPQADSRADMASSQDTAYTDHSEDRSEAVEESQKHDSEADLETAPCGKFNSCFNGLAKIGPLALLAAIACMAWPIFWQPLNAVYCPAELKSVTAFLHSIASSSWLAPTGLNGDAWTAAQWPVFSWVTGMIALSPGLIESGYLLPTVTFLCAFFAVLGAWCLSHAAGFGYKAAFAAGLILLCSPAFAPLPAFVGPATLASGFLLFALVFFCRGWSAESAWFSLPIAFILTSFAFLSGGWFFLATPLIASFCFLIWRGSFRRAHKFDAIFGFVLLIAIIGIWLGWIMLGHVNDSYLASLFEDSWHIGWPIHLKWLAPAAIGIIGTMPWLLMIFGVNWARVLGQTGKSLSASRHDNGSALVWISLAIALPVAICTSPFHPAGIAIACMAAVLLGKAMLNLGEAGNRFFCLLASLCLIAAGCIILCASFPFTQQYLFSLLPPLPVADLTQKLQSLSMLPIMGILVLLGGLAGLMFVKRFSGAGPLIYAILLVIILCQPARLKLVPELTAMPGSPLVTFAHIEGMVMDALAAPAPNNSPASLPQDQAPAVPEIGPLEPSQPAQEPQASHAAPESAQPQQTPAYKMPGAPVLTGPEAPQTDEPAAPAESAQRAPETPPAEGAAPSQESPQPEPASPEPGQDSTGTQAEETPPTSETVPVPESSPEQSATPAQ